MAIGGGDVLGGETESIDRTLVELSGVDRPKLLFIPTASQDAEGYVDTITEAYGRLGCTVSALRLWGEDGNAEIAAKKIDAADVIYVGGGNTKALIALWKELQVDKALKSFLDSGRPAGGLSAGALCWFSTVNSDWPQFEAIPGVNTAPLECLGFVDLALCPHTRDEGFRLSEFREMMRDVPGAGVGLDDACAIQIRGEEYRILASQPGAVAHLMFSENGMVREAEMPPHNDFRPLNRLRRGVI
ncbi:Type 1 glutamine amidotransferase-like domain-containing protein [Fimbriimonas ginsengisoli]|uniref:Peptidase S51 dipeptidase E n=1 Tax=Fimbriimonas ginsengisoli Gsoil 348 TaxID=661478 RepID=A0A068NYJ7_FIMGI|nr:Type 1 glutamine amidotransferase-like domain-containing protein [Fimbriimonas ginsengisoli]AIE87009.1 peptidase S51 dipeptidase E [Fimbriimonas ginsengisoli Gsoil 348]